MLSKISRTVSKGSTMKLAIEGAVKRQVEISMLQQAAQDIKFKNNNAYPRTILVHGKTGTGKSTLTKNAFENYHTSNDFWFSTSKVHQSSPPFDSIRHLFLGLTGQILDSDDVAKCRDSLKQQFTEWQKSFLFHFMSLPRIGELLDTADTPKVDLQQNNNFSQELLNQVKWSLRSFLRVVSTFRPTILVLDDIMHSDPSTFDILQLILTDDNLNNILFIATYNDDIVNDDHPLIEWQEQIQKVLKAKSPCGSNISCNKVNVTKSLIQTIKVENLTLEEATLFLSACTRSEEKETTEAARILHERTIGNLFFIVEMLKLLVDKNLISYDCMTGKWKISIRDIESQLSLADNVASVVCSRIENLPNQVKQTITLASSFGAWIDKRAMKLAYDSTDKDLETSLDVACREKVLIRQSEHNYKFAHDQVEMAAYHLLPKGSELTRMHYNIGQKLLNNINISSDDDTLLYACADQLKNGLGCVTCGAEAFRVAQLSLAAGKRAAASFAFIPSAEYFYMGITVLGGEKAFQSNHALSSDLHLFFSQVQLSSGKLMEARLAAEKVLEHATRDEMRMKATVVLLCSYQGDFEKLASIGIDMLNSLGEKIPRKPNRVKMFFEVKMAVSAMRSKSNIDEILKLPRMDAKKASVMKILHSILAPAFLDKRWHMYFIIISSRMISNTLRHGLSEYSASALASFGLCLLSFKAMAKEALQLAELSIGLMESVPSIDAGTCLGFSGIILTTEPSRKFLDVIMNGYRYSMKVGDPADACMALTMYNFMYFYDGIPVKPLLQDVKKFTPQMLEYNQVTSFLINLPTWQCLLNLCDESINPCDMENGEAINLAGGGNMIGENFLRTYWMQISFYMGNLEHATEQKALIDDEPDKLMFRHCPFFQARIFFYSLICIENYRNNRNRKDLIEARMHSRRVKLLVKKGFIKLLHKFQIMDAEIQSVLSKDSDYILRMYDLSIDSSARAGYLQDGALANYLCGRYCLSMKKLNHRADLYIRKSHEMYLSWGADSVAKSIEQRHPSLFTGESVSFVSKPCRGRTYFRESVVERHKAVPRSA